MFRQVKSNRQDFEQQALPHLDALYGMALRLAHNERDAEDLIQDTMVKAFRFYHRFEKDSNIKAWLFKVLINTFYNSCRKDKNIQKLNAEAEVDYHYEQFLSEASTSWQNAEKQLIDAQLMEQLRQAIEGLPEEFRLVVVLADLNDFSYKEISEILNCPVGTVMSRLYRGRRILQKKFYHYALEHGLIAPPKPTDHKTARLADYRLQKGRA